MNFYKNKIILFQLVKIHLSFYVYSFFFKGVTRVGGIKKKLSEELEKN